MLSPPEQKVILKGVSWDTYNRLLNEHEESAATRFNYDQGVLEIMVLSFEHETLKHVISIIVELLAGELGIDIHGAGSTTFRREDLAKGFEPDACFYIRHAAEMRGKKEVDLRHDPPPDLVIEIDITSPSLDKFPIYFAAGVSEVWRYTDGRLVILTRQGNAFGEQNDSFALPKVTAPLLNVLIESSQRMDRPAWLRQIRESARAL